MTDKQKQDVFFMTLALEQAKKAEFIARPNPAVGCVLVKDGVIIGQGFTQKVGEAHAEIMALKNAKDTEQDVAGARAYVTLEPCSHYGHTPPCAAALVQANVASVVVGTLDSNPMVAGRGVAHLMDAGIDVTVGVCENEARAINAGFLKAMTTGLPYIRLKIACSLDGRTAMANGQSKWITGDEARADVQRLRAKSAAIITGSGTILADDPALNVRLPNLDIVNIPKPKIVVVDRSHRLNNTDDYQVFKEDSTLLWRDDLPSLLKKLADYRCYDVLVEAGHTLTTAFLEAKLIDELIIYQAPCLLGKTAKVMFDGIFDDLSQKLDFQLVSYEAVGKDTKLILKPN